MSTNFEALKDSWPYLYKLASLAEDYVYTDPQGSVSKIRLLAERYTSLIGKVERIKFPPGNDNQFSKLKILENEDILEDDKIRQAFHNIRKEGNQAVHYQYDDTDKSMAILREAHYLTNWFVEVYGDYDIDTNPNFINPVRIIEKQEEISKEDEKEFSNSLKELEKKTSSLPEEELTRQANIRRRKSRSFTNADLNEADTRTLLIDPKLRQAGWVADSKNINWQVGTRPEDGKNMAIAEVPVKNGKADYMLFLGLKPVGIVEAKKFGKDISQDLEQGKIYAKNLKSLSFYQGIEDDKVADSQDQSYEPKEIPFIYASNGREYLKQLESKSGIWYLDNGNKSIAKPIGSFHSPENLEQILDQHIKEAETKLKTEVYPDFASRYYQKEAVAAVDNAIINGKDRMLLALATGTGKTRIAISIMYRFIKTKRFRRILFLVDRKSLGIQTQDALKDIEVEGKSISDIYNIKELYDVNPDIETKIQVATVQGMVQRLFYQEDDSKIPKSGDYDFIIVDEAHRGYIEDRDMTDDELSFASSETYISQYRRVIDYYDAKILGLTATPALHTTEIFGPPIYTYTYKQAVIDGYLVDYGAPISMKTLLNQNGIKFDKDQEVEVYRKDTGTVEKYLLEDELNFDVESFNKTVLTESFNRVILTELTNYISPNGAGKTLIFAASDNHADMIVNILKEAYLDKGFDISDDSIQKITGSIYNQERAIRQFKNEKNPNIAVTVDLLTTGIDVPEITNLVFLRRVRSRILFEQMIGRATRLAPDIGKDYFTVYDPVRLFEFLEDVSDMKPVVKNPHQSIEDILVDIENVQSLDQFTYHKEELIGKLQRKKQRLSEESIKELEESLDLDSLDDFLRDVKDMDQQKILAFGEYFKKIEAKRNPSSYQYIISHHEDEIIEVGPDFGKVAKKPGDYLEEFKKFILENIDLIPALNIVVTSPKDLTYKDLKQIELVLKDANFDTRKLNDAWNESKKDYITADIISFIRTAALGEELLDHEDKIRKVMRKVYGMAKWNPMQMDLLKKIETQLLASPVLAPSAKEYFDTTEVWRQQGGYNFMEQRFGNQIDIIIKTINENLYAA